MPGIASFRAVAQNSAASARVHLGEEQQVLAARAARGGSIQWVREHVNSKENRAVTEQFLESLRDSHGDQISKYVATSLGLLDSNLNVSSRPLQARHITSALEMADDMKLSFIEGNQAAEASYLSPLPTGGENITLRGKVEQAIKHYFGEHLTSGEVQKYRAFFDIDQLAGEIRGAIHREGQQGNNLVTTERATKIVEEKIKECLQPGPFHDAFVGKLDLKDKDSLAQRALTQACTAADIEIDVRTLDAQALNKLQSKLNQVATEQLNSLVSQIDRGETEDRLGQGLSEHKLMAKSEDIIQSFVQNRVAAHAEVKELEVSVGNTAQVQVLKQFALNSDLDAAAVKPLYTALGQIQATTTQLANECQNPSPRHLSNMGAAFKQIHEMAQTLELSNLPESEREVSIDSAWKVLLSGHSQDELRTLANALLPQDSPAWKFIDGACFLQYRMSAAPEFQTNPEYQVSQQKAAEHTLVLKGLVEHLARTQNVTSGGVFAPTVEHREDLPDETFAMLRNAGMTIPAPMRLNTANKDTALSDETLSMVDQGLRQEFHKNVEMEGDVAKQLMSDLQRGFYQIGDELFDHTDPEKTMVALRKFCTDGAGNLNKDLLLAISKSATQTSLGVVEVSVNATDDTKAVIRPIATGVKFGTGFTEIFIDRDQQRNVSIDIRNRGQIEMSIVPTWDEAGQLVPVALELDEERSFRRINLNMTLDGSGKQEPQMTNLKFAYGFYEPQEEENRVE